MKRNLKFSLIFASVLFAQGAPTDTANSAQGLNSGSNLASNSAVGGTDLRKTHAAEHINLADVVVSANKMNERLKDVAGSVSVLSDIEIEERRINDVQDVIRQIPNMNYTTFISKTMVNFRGINSSAFTNSNPVAVYIDGVATTNHYGFYNSCLTNVERVEVLRGPQTALYGKDSIGGVINIVSRTPNNDWGGNMGLEYGSYTKFSSNLDLGGALIDDKLFLNLGASVMNDNGWIKNDFNNDKKAAQDKGHKFNATITATPVDRLTARLNLTHEKQKEYFFKGGAGFYGQIKRKDAKHANFDMPTYTDSKAFSQSLGIDYEFDGAKLSSVSTHKSSVSKGMYDIDFTRGTSKDGLSQFQDVKIDGLTQELRLSSLNSDKFKWIGGVYFENEKTTNRKMGTDLFLNPVTKKTETMNAPAMIKAHTAAVFGQGDYKIIDNLRLILGGRYQKIEKKIDENLIYSTQNPAFGMVNFSYSDKKTWTKFLPKVGLNLAVNDDLSVFANYSQGYLAGGYNYFATRGSADQNRFNAQTSDNYEIGLHGSRAGLHYGATLFYMDIKDIHMYKILPGNVFITSNGGKASSQGLELEAAYYADNGLDFSASLGINKTKYKQNETPGAKGKKIENTPAFNANLGIGYTHASGVYARADIHAVGTTYYDNLNQNKQKAYAFADLRAGYRTDALDIYSYVSNVTNTEYTSGYMEHAGNFGMVHYGDPRRIGVGIRYSF